ncbi:MAG: adenosylcobinamide-phosphate synthase CbiB [Pelagimonas sp.]|jgi:adenosylcobinamide-phosphate synthase|nr:adenosylcobinamide-phosphate synthase CbiB [Pelagimonas sp.]
MLFSAAILVGFLIDAALGWPAALFRRVSHPVVWIGALISWLEARLNKGAAMRRRAAGGVCVLIVLLAVGVPSFAVQNLLPDGWVGAMLIGVLCWPLIATRSMHDHVQAVAAPLLRGDLASARHAVSMIVGRDPAQLDEAGVARAALESLAENSSDGIVAPVFWGVVLGLPGIALYKAVNTMDSMIGHRNDRYEEFGKIAARLDDVVNLIPARLTGVLFALASGNAVGTGLRVMMRDAGLHRSPNAGWPEGALAGALGLRLSGPRQYGDRIADEPWVHAEGRDPYADDLARGLALFRRAMLLCGAVLALLAMM